jgi:hypothetical protein
VALAKPAQGRVKGFPRVALLRDYAGGTEPAQLIATFAREAGDLITLLVTIPENELLEAEKSCDCAATAEQLKGFPIRGALLAAQPVTETLRVRHYEVPGIFSEGAREFKVAADVMARAPEVGQPFLGRVERRGEQWWLFDVRWIAAAPTK